MGDDARLAASRRGEDEKRTVPRDDGLLLRRIQIAEKRLGVQHGRRLYRARSRLVPRASRGGPDAGPPTLVRPRESRITRA